MRPTSLHIIKERLTEIAPGIIEKSLNNGAAPQEFEQLETLIEKKLPTDFIDLYRIYNGMNSEENWGSLFYGMSFLSIDDIIEDYKFRVNHSKGNECIPLKKNDPEIDASNMYNLNWICISSDGARSGLYVDLSPGNKGSYGQVIFIDGTYLIGFHVAGSIAELVDNFAADLQNNLYYLEPDALEDGHHFLETAPGIDLVNWYTVDKWKHLGDT